MTVTNGQITHVNTIFEVSLNNHRPSKEQFHFCCVIVFQNDSKEVPP